MFLWPLRFGNISVLVTFAFLQPFCLVTFVCLSISHQPSSIIHHLIDCPSPLGKAGWARHSWSWSLITTTHYRLQTTTEFSICNPVEASLPDGLVNHTLSIWWERSSQVIFFFNHLFALIIQELFLKINKINGTEFSTVYSGHMGCPYTH